MTLSGIAADPIASKTQNDLMEAKRNEKEKRLNERKRKSDAEVKRFFEKGGCVHV